MKRNKDTEDHTSESIEEVESLQNANNKDNIKFEFIPHFTYCKEEFKNSSKSIKSIIKSCINQSQTQIAIGNITNYYKMNLDTILENYKCSAKQMKMFNLEMEKEFKDELRHLKVMINEYSNLNQLYQDREVILNSFVEKYNSKTNIEFINQDLFKLEIKNIKKETMTLLKVKAKALYKEEIKTLINNFNDKVEEEILLSFNNQNWTGLKEKTLNKIKEFISYMNDDWFELLEYHSSKLPNILLRINEDSQNYVNLMCIIRYIKNSTSICFEKYVVWVLNNQKTIFSKIKSNYIVAYKASLKKYITEMKEYVTLNPLSDNSQQNYCYINKNFICKVFERLETEITEDTEKLSLNLKKNLREMFSWRWKEKVKELYYSAVKKIKKKYSKYKNDFVIVDDLTECEKLLIERIYNYSSIILPSFIWDKWEDLIIDRKLLEKLMEEFKSEWKTKHNDIIKKIGKERK